MKEERKERICDKSFAAGNSMARLLIYSALFMTILLINVAVALAQAQYHPLSQVYPMDKSIDLQAYQLNASYVNASNSYVRNNLTVYDLLLVGDGTYPWGGIFNSTTIGFYSLVDSGNNGFAVRGRTTDVTVEGSLADYGSSGSGWRGVFGQHTTGVNAFLANGSIAVYGNDGGVAGARAGYFDGDVYVTDNVSAYNVTGRNALCIGTDCRTVWPTGGGGTFDGGGSPNNITKWVDANTLGNSSIYETGGKIGIGTTSPLSALHVQGGIMGNASGTSDTFGLFGQKNSSIFGAIGTGNYGGWFRNTNPSTEAMYGVHARANGAGTGQRYGVHGEITDASYGCGVRGKYNDTVEGCLGQYYSGNTYVGGAYGAFGSNFGYLGNNYSGVFGQSTSIAVVGYNNESLNRGELGSSNYGVYGSNGTLEGYLGGDQYGAYGKYSDSVFGALGSPSGYGVYGFSDVHDAIIGLHISGFGFGTLRDVNAGVYGESNAGPGIYGKASSTYTGVVGEGGAIGVNGTGTTYGIYGSGGTYAGYFLGNVSSDTDFCIDGTGQCLSGATGTITGTGGDSEVAFFVGLGTALDSTSNFTWDYTADELRIGPGDAGFYVLQVNASGRPVSHTAIYGGYDANNYGWLGRNNFGVHGNGAGRGVVGNSSSYTDPGVPGGVGVMGLGGLYGVYGKGGTAAGYFAGNVNVTGNITAGTSSVFIDGTNSMVGIGTHAPQAVLDVLSSDTAALGTNATPVLNITGGDGGNVSGGVGGDGSSMSLEAGSGGGTSSANNLDVGGKGGGLVLSGGDGGSVSGMVVGITGGSGGDITLSAGDGGAASAMIGGDGGDGGDILLNPGDGGSGTGGSGDYGDVIISGSSYGGLGVGMDPDFTGSRLAVNGSINVVNGGNNALLLYDRGSTGSYSGIRWMSNNSAGSLDYFGSIRLYYSNKTSGYERSYLSFRTMYNSEAERMRLSDDGRLRVGFGLKDPEASLHVISMYYSEPAAIIGSGDSNATGYSSVAMGRAVNASGDYSVAMGYNTTAALTGDFAAGYLSNATGGLSVAMGYDSLANGSNSFAAGSSNVAGNSYAVAIGQQSHATGYGAVAMGRYATASGYDSVSLGFGSLASGLYSFAAGNNDATGNYSVALGYGSEASANRSYAFGYNAQAKGVNSTALGMNVQVTGENTVGMSLRPALDVINADNAFVIMGGNVGIGATAPTQLLTVEGSSPNIALLNNAESKSSLMLGDADTPSQHVNISYDSASPNLTIQFGGSSTPNVFIEPDGAARLCNGPCGDIGYALGGGELYVEADLEVDNVAYINGLYANSIYDWNGFTAGTANTALCFTATAGAEQIYDCPGAPADYAEWYRSAAGESLEPGDIVVAVSEEDTELNKHFAVKRSDSESFMGVIGVVSSRPNFIIGEDVMPEEIYNSVEPVVNHNGKQYVALTLSGRVPVKATAINGKISAGDLLTPSGMAGHAMKLNEWESGVVVGKALGSLDSGEGIVEMHFELGQYTAPKDKEIQELSDAVAKLKQLVCLDHPDADICVE